MNCLNSQPFRLHPGTWGHVAAQIGHGDLTLTYRHCFFSLSDLVARFAVSEKARLGYCAPCNIFQSCWSCPGLNGQVSDYNTKDWRNVFLYTLYTDVPYDAEDDDTYSQVIDTYGKIASLALQHSGAAETVLSGKAMIDGRCAACRVCTAAMNPPEPCVFPDKLRSSLEALGFNVIRISKALLDHKMTWHATPRGRSKSVPPEMSVVHGILTDAQALSGPLFEPWMSTDATDWLTRWKASKG